MGATPCHDSLVGQTLGHYHIAEKIGAGGMGEVYRARDEHLARDVAIKVLPSGTLTDEIARKHFHKEALILSQLNHPNVATIHDFDTQQDVDFLVMEYIPGITLSEKVATGPLPEKEVLRLGVQFAEGLAAAHEHGVIHRDLKPGNLRVTSDGRLKILDFGLAKLRLPVTASATTESVSETQAMAGTLPYMAPEQLLGAEIDARTDIHAAGLVLYEMATGQRPFAEVERSQVIGAILRKSPVSPAILNPKVSPELERIIGKCLEKEPEDRYQSAKELAIDLRRMTFSHTDSGGPYGRVHSPGTNLIADLKLVHRSTISQWVGINPRRVAWLGILLVLAIAVFLARGRLLRHPRVGAVQVLIGDFENRTGETVFDQTLRELLSTSLQQSELLRVYPYSRLPDVLQRMNKPPSVRIDEEIGLDILQREGLQALVSGSISKLGKSYVLLVKAVSPTAENLVITRREISDVSQLPAAVDAMTKKIRTSLGESDALVEKNFQPLAKVTSSSLEAIHYFSYGKQRLYAANPQEAAVLFRRAVELDPNFAIAHEYLAIAYYQLGDVFRAGKSFQDASRLIDHVTEVEKQKILGDFNLFNEDYDQAIQHFQLLEQLQPQDPAVHLNLAESYSGKFQFDAALTEVKMAVRLTQQAGPINNLAAVYFWKGDTDQALATSLRILQTNPNDGRALERSASCYLVKGQLDDAKRGYESLIALGGQNESRGQAGLADLALARGLQREARAHFEAGMIVDETLGNLYSFADKQFKLASLASRTDDKRLPATIKRIEEAGSSSYLILLAGRIYAHEHLYEQAERQLHILQQKASDNPVPSRRSFVHLLKADLAAARGRSKQAVAEAKLAVTYENSTFAVESLAHAYRAAGMHTEAAHEFENVLHRGNERRESYDGPAFYKVVEDHYWLAASYQAMGQDDLAQSHLETFLTYWSQADPELGIYRDAKRRLELLRRSFVGFRHTGPRDVKNGFGKPVKPQVSLDH